MSRVAELLGPEGPLSRELTGYEHRPGQLAMAEAVERALAEGHTLVCEAGTGTGKTLAYLVPAILSGRKVVISTATKALQDQIYFHDLPAIERHLGLHPDVALAKGLPNYLCLRRFNEFRGSQEALRPRYAQSLALLEQWVKETETGDVSELVSLPEGDPIWSEVCSTSDTRRGGKCERYAECFVTRMRRHAEQAQIVVANHALVFADLALRGHSDDQGGALPTYEAIVFDEAHQMEDVATDFFGVQVSSSRIDALLRDLAKAFGKANPGAVLSIDDAPVVAEQVHRASEAFFAQLEPRHGTAEAGRKLLPKEDWIGPIVDAYHRLDTALEGVEKLCEANRRDDAIQSIGSRALQVREDLALIAATDEAHAVTWIETRTRSAVVGSTPIEVAGTLRSGVFEKVPSVVLTSATLSTGGSFSFFRARVGADSDMVSTQELLLPSPFDFASRALLYTPTDLPDPTDPGFSHAVAARAAELIAITGGGAFVLCTSVRAMGIIHDELSRMLAKRPMLQGDAPKQMLLSRFRADGHAVLVATMSFWEGVDVAGDALRLVVIDKIPFAVPTDPVVSARCHSIEEQGGNPFVSYQVPSAAIALKQGFGRLIRTQRDRGIVGILDRRIVLKGYGKTLRASLPPASRVGTMDEVKAFWGRMQGGA